MDRLKSKDEEGTASRRVEVNNANSRHDDKPLPKGKSSSRQIDDNQDDLGRDVNDPSQISNEINKRA